LAEKYIKYLEKVRGSAR